MFTEEQQERLVQWSNVYGWRLEHVMAAAEADPRLRALRDVEVAAGGMPEAARAIREQITRIEACHREVVANVRRILAMIGEMAPASIPGCGQVDPALAEELRGTMAAMAAWVDGNPDAAGALVASLGQRTPAKQWLVACLSKTLTEQLKGVQGAEPLRQPAWPCGR